MSCLPVDLPAGTILVAAPHMDDEVLACGGLIAQLDDPSRVHVVYATDGTKSPAPIIPGRDRIAADHGKRRCDESVAAMGVLGVPAANLHFLGLPEAELPRHEPELARRLVHWIRDLAPAVVLCPFRYDRHPDHLAVNRVVTEAKRAGQAHAELLEYFVYHRSRLLPRGDVRAYLRPECLVKVDIARVAERKRAALACFSTQTTRYYEWQMRPILQPALLDEECARPEQFLRFDPALPGARVFTSSAMWIQVANRIEPSLVRWKYLFKSRVHRAR